MNNQNEPPVSERARWSILHVNGGSEIALKNALLGALGEYIDRIYVPMETIKLWRNNEKTTQLKPIMNYVFVLSTLEFNKPDIYKRITTGYRFVSFLSDSEFAQMEKELSGIETTIDTSLSVGAKVEIHNGSFTGLNGQVQSIDGSMAEVRVILTEDLEPMTVMIKLSDLVRIVA